MKIGIIDDYFIALQGKLLEEGHSLKILIADAPVLPKNALYASHHDVGKVQQAMALDEFGDCDLIVAGNLSVTYAGDYLKQMFPDIPLVYYSASCFQMEEDRSLTHALLARYTEETKLRLPTKKAFTILEDAQAYIDDATDALVIKQNIYSPKDGNTFRTVIVPDPSEYSIPALNNWFDTDGTGGCFIEEFIHGQEVSFGMWFNGDRFVGQPYYYIEHKGACNGDRGGVLTNEVGTTLSYFVPSEHSEVMKIFRAMEPMFRGKCNGMIDWNCILTDDDELYFLEYTLRFGRPTLEMQIAAAQFLSVPVGDWLLEHASGQPSQDYFITSDLHVVGVTGFTYGLPLLTNVAAMTGTDVSALVPSMGTRFDPTMFEVDDPTGCVWLPMLTLWNVDEEAYVITGEDRHFICCGLSSSPVGARLRAYAQLDNVNLRGVTWRDDVGDALPKLEQRLAETDLL